MEITYNKNSLLFPIKDSSHVGNARRQMLLLAQQTGFNETESGKVGIIVTEMATNLIKHAGGGTLIVRRVEQNQIDGLEIIALDNGPGIADIDLYMEGGHSTAGSLGIGLGAIARLAARFDIYSQPTKGTVISVILWSKTAPAPPENHDFGVICMPIKGETVCGDSWSVIKTATNIKILVVDGLGHGIFAAEAAHAAINTFEEKSELSAYEMIHAIHGALRSTRGAAVAVAGIDSEQQRLHYAAVGNIAGAILEGIKSRGLLTYNGTVGHTIYKYQELDYPFSPGALLIMHSDGLATHWNLDNYPGLRQHSASIIAGVLFRDFNRDLDDTTILVFKN